MLNIITLFLMIIWGVIISVIYLYDKNTLGSNLTPFNILILPIYLITFITYIMSLCSEVKYLHTNTILIFIIFTILFRFLGGVGEYLANNLYKKNKKITFNTSKVDKLMYILGVFSVSILLLDFINKIRKFPKVSFIVNEGFQAQYTGGVNFYLRLICFFCVIYFLGTYKKGKKKNILVAILFLLPIFLTFVKGMIIMPCVGGAIMYCIINNKNLKLKNILLVSVLGIFFFLIVYFIEITIWDKNNIYDISTYKTMSDKFISYLTSGIQSFNYNISNNLFFNVDIVDNPIFSPFIKFLSKFNIVESNGYIPSNQAAIYSVFSNEYKYSNVNSFFGTLLLYSGWFKSIFMVGFISIYSYFLLIRAKYNQDLVSKLIYSTFASGLVMGWFEYYYLQTFWVYMICIIEIIKIYICKFYRVGGGVLE